MEHYEEILIASLIGSICFSAGQLVFQIKQKDKLEARIDALTKQVVESRIENGVIIGCLYALAGAVGDPKIKEIVERMLMRDSASRAGNV